MDDLKIKNVVFDYFSGQATPLQKKAIEEWLQNETNHERYYQWLHEWEGNHLQATASWQDAFSRTQDRVTQIPSESNPFLAKMNTTSWWTRNKYQLVAAVFLITLLGAGLVGFRDTLLYKTIEVGYGQTQQVMLNDGSRVTLNANSSLRFPRFGFGSGPRQVELVGEADFQIKHSLQNQRFVVHTSKGMNITVLGTEFTVFARQRRSQITLRTGKVALQMSQSPKAPPIIMAPGDLVMIDKGGKLIRSHTPNPEIHASWKNHQVTLERTSLDEIAAILEETYGFQVELQDPELGKRTATGLLPAQNADEALELIADLFDLNFTRHNTKIVFKD